MFKKLQKLSFADVLVMLIIFAIFIALYLKFNANYRKSSANYQNPELVNSNSKVQIIPVSNMNKARSHHSSISLKDGRILILGGSGDVNSSITGEIFDPKTRKFSLVPSYSKIDIDHNYPVLLANGDVIIVSSFGIVRYDLRLNKLALDNLN